VIPQILQYDHEKEFIEKMAQILKELKSLQNPIIIQSVTMSNGIPVFVFKDKKKPKSKSQFSMNTKITREYLYV
jgi:hypothetical protein